LIEYRITAYDAIYITLAPRLNAALITLDKTSLPEGRGHRRGGNLSPPDRSLVTLSFALGL